MGLVRLDPILTMRDIYVSPNPNPLTNSLAAAKAPQLKISSHVTSFNLSQKLSHAA